MKVAFITNSSDEFFKISIFECEEGMTQSKALEVLRVYGLGSVEREIKNMEILNGCKISRVYVDKD